MAPKIPRNLSRLKKFKITDRHRFPEQPGLYFVSTGWGVKYVGMTTTTFRSRWQGHHRYEQARRAGASIRFWPCRCGETRLRQLEKDAISHYRPPWNNTKVQQSPSLLPVFAAIALIAVLLLN